jgi:hypothetical protein
MKDSHVLPNQIGQLTDLSVAEAQSRAERGCQTCSRRLMAMEVYAPPLIHRPGGRLAHVMEKSAEFQHILTGSFSRQPCSQHSAYFIDGAGEQQVRLGQEVL